LQFRLHHLCLKQQLPFCLAHGRLPKRYWLSWFHLCCQV
jgi:hypothetical protein